MKYAAWKPFSIKIWRFAWYQHYDRPMWIWEDDETWVVLIGKIYILNRRKSFP